VRSIACYGAQFIACTKDGSWWHNNQPLAIPATIDAHRIRRIAWSNESYFVIRELDSNAVLIGLNATPITEIETVASLVRTVLTENGIMNAYQLLQMRHEDFRQMQFFRMHQEQLTNLIRHIHALLTSLQLPLIWPDQALNPNTLLPDQQIFGWYGATFSTKANRTDTKPYRFPSFLRSPTKQADPPKQTAVSSAKPTTSTSDDFADDDFFGDLFRDLDS
jgi:hypothetical protein